MKQLCVLQGFLPINQKKLLTSEFVTLQINVHLLLIASEIYPTFPQWAKGYTICLK